MGIVNIDNYNTIAFTSTMTTHSTTRINTRTSDDNFLFHEDIHLGILALVNESTVINWSPDDFTTFSNLFDYDVYEQSNDQTMRIWTDQTRHVVFTRSGLCSASKQFKDSGSVKKHIVIADLNENWGCLSTPVPNRTVDWGDLESHWKKAGCNKADIMTYLDHEHTLAVFTTQHQAFAHPKVHSIPLGTHGVENGMEIVALTRKNTLNRTNLLMINSLAYLTRKGQLDAVLKSFHDKGYMLNNTYGMSKDQYYDEMRKSKFIMCPSGLGWDTYRMWEAFYLGIIPVVEKYNRRDGWHKTMDGLPIVWVNTFEEGLNPAFLESEYKRIVAAKEQYKFEKLTVQYWKAFVESFLPDTNETSHLLTPHNSRIPNEDIKDMKQVNSSNKSEVNHAAANTGGIRLISSSMRHMDINPKSTKVLIIRNERAKITKGHQVTLA